MGKAVVDCVVHPTPAVMQQYSFCSVDHIIFQLPTPLVQSYGSVEVKRLERSHQSNNSNNGTRKQREMMQVKSLRGRATSKSPPQPTYL